MHDTIRVWKATSEFSAIWHVSIGDHDPMQQLRKHAGAVPDEHLGCAWDEALEAIVLAMVAPGSLLQRSLHMEPPAGTAWSAMLEIQPLAPGKFRVRSRDEECGELTLGEALAMVVKLTYPQGWRGFRTERSASFAVVPVTRSA